MFLLHKVVALVRPELLAEPWPNPGQTKKHRKTGATNLDLYFLVACKAITRFTQTCNFNYFLIFLLQMSPLTLLTFHDRKVFSWLFIFGLDASGTADVDKLLAVLHPVSSNAVQNQASFKVQTQRWGNYVSYGLGPPAHRPTL